MNSLIHWWERGVIYQIYPRSFRDANADGIGDLRGITDKLDYCAGLQVDALWLSPIYPSPMADFGYDVADYTGVDPMFGTLDDFDLLLKETSRRGMKLILDFVPNHTSDHHPWFTASRTSRDDPKRDWYLWHDPAPDGGPPNNWLSNFGGSAWEWDAATQQYYYHSFLKEQPDLNWRNPEVIAAMHEVLRFWLRRGVAGFRVDVLWLLIKDNEWRDNPPNPDYTPSMPLFHSQIPLYTTDRPENQDVVAGLRAVVDEFDDRVLIGEIYLPLNRLVAYYGKNLKGVQLPFNFQLLQAPWDARNIADLIDRYESALPEGGWPNWVLGNHDNPRIASKVGAAQARVAALILLTLRGTPTLYYGDEIGMHNVPIPPDRIQDPLEKNVPGKGLGRDPSRTPMQWDTSAHAGFGDQEPWLPIAADSAQINVAVEAPDPASLLSLYRRLLQLRKQHEALAVGAYQPIAARGAVLAYVRHSREQRLLIVANLGADPAEFGLQSMRTRHSVLLSTYWEGTPDIADTVLSLRPDEGVIFELDPPAGAPPMINDLWYKNAVIYCLSVATFMDANGDGVGDFSGLMRRLDYLQGLGVTAIWLMPFQTSPCRDDGYDIADYYNVDQRFGTLGDFVEFTHAAKQRGIRVIIDLVVNHTSNEHTWFKQACKNPDSPYRDWYVWSKKRPRNANKGMVFPGVQKSTWTFEPKARAWYFHRFYDFQPDLNTANQRVQAEILKIMGFWIQLGVSGFRMDAVPFVIATKGATVAKPAEQYDMLRTFREFLQWREGDAIILAEANVLPDTDMEYFGRAGDRMHMMFNFTANQHLFYALAAADARPLQKALKATKPRPKTAQWGMFLRNHDELDLGRLTKTQRDAVFAAFGSDKSMQLYDRGIRRRLAPMLEGDRRRIELAYSLMFTLPGTPVLRYGDEIAMGDDLSLPERNCARTPMQWSTEPQAGFTESNKPILPVISDGAFGYPHVNAAQQRRDPNSMLNWMERIIRMRKEIPEVGWGDFEFIATRDNSVLAIRYDWRNNSVLFLHNLSSTPREVHFSVGLGAADQTLVNVLSDDHSQPDRQGRHSILLEAYGYRWYRVGGLDYLLKRTDIDTHARQ